MSFKDYTNLITFIGKNRLKVSIKEINDLIKGGLSYKEVIAYLKA